MISVIDLIVCAHEPDARMVVVTFGSIAVIPFAVELNEEPVVNVAVISRITVYSHVLDACDIKEHLAACVVNVAVTASSGKSSVSCSLIGKPSSDMRVIDIAVNPVEDSSCRLDLAASPKACHDLGSHLVCSRFLA